MSATRTVVFHRATTFYMLQLPLTDSLAKHAELNPGTLKITDIRGKVLWLPTSEAKPS